MRSNYKNQKPGKDIYPTGRNIRAPASNNVLLIDENNVNCGTVSYQSALDRAKSVDLDLVQVSPEARGTITCKILDYAKFKYEMKKKDKASKKKQRESVSKLKEIRFRPSTNENDLKTKAKQAEVFIREGHKVKVTIMFKGREMAYKSKAVDTLQSFIAMVPSMKMVSVPSMTGRNLSALCDRAESSGE